jgi:hypothetical protein
MIDVDAWACSLEENVAPHSQHTVLELDRSAPQ